MGFALHTFPMGGRGLLLFALVLACFQAGAADAARIRDLQAVATTKGIVRLRGVVTFHEPTLGGTFIQDDSGAIEIRPGTASIAAGQWLEIEGTLDRSTGRPVVEVTRLALVGEAPLPNPRPLTNPVLSDLHGQYVEASAIARSVSPVPHSTFAQIAVELLGRRVIVLMQSSMVPQPIVACRILVRGIMVADEPSRILAHSIETIAPPLAVRPITEGQNGEPRLARAEGTVIYSLNPRHFFLENPQYAVEVLTVTPHDLPVGERAEVIGFPRATGFFLEDATAARLPSLGTSPPVTVREITAAHNGRLITLVGEVAAAEGTALILSAHGSLVPAYVPGGTPLPRPRSRVEITGMGRTNAFGPTLWLRDSRDIRLLDKPSFWNANVLAILLGVAALFLLAMLARRFWPQPRPSSRSTANPNS